MRGVSPSLAFFRRPLVIAGSIFLLVAASAGLVHLLAAPLEEPRANDRQVTRLVVQLMGREHLSKHELDDTMAERALDLFLKSLDPMKVYFYQSDVDEFMKERHNIDDTVKEGDIAFAYTVFNRFLERVDERVTLIDELLAKKPDFSDHEEMIVDRDLARYPRDAQEARERWRKRLEYDLLVLKGDKTEGDEAVERLTKRYHSFGKRMHQTNGDDLLEMYVTAVTQGFDPHTTYMSPTSYENFIIMMSLELEGIGAALQSEDGQTKVTKIIPGGAADKHGKLKVEDVIVSVGQGAAGSDKEEEAVDVVDMKLDDVVKMIRGKAGTVVRLGVIPGGETETKTYEITRARIELSDSEARSEIIEEGKKEDGTSYKVGYIDLPSFYMDMEGAREGREDYKSTTRDVRAILEKFNEQHVDAVVLDLRQNGGGSLTEAINLTGLFVDEGPVVQVKDSADAVEHYDDLERGMVWEGPLVVLTSKFSASASEILAGAIQDYHRGLIVGDESTHGKGTVQSLLDLGRQLFRGRRPPNLGALKITMQQFYRPNGDSTQKRGVLSDVVLPSLTNHIEGISEADLDFAMEFDRVPASDYKKMESVNDEMIARLRAGSENRVAQSEDFKKQARKIDRYREQKSKKTVSLNEQEFFAARAEFDADKEEEKEFEEIIDPKEKVVDRDFYFNEALAVTLDYVKELGKNGKVAAK